MSLKKNIIFDMDGVLFNTEELTLRCYAEVGRRFGLPDIVIPARECIGGNAVRTKRVITEYFAPKEIPYDEIRAARSQLIHDEVHRNGMPMKPGVYEIMKWLREEGWKTGLASSTARETVEDELSLCGLRECFDVMVCGNQVNRSKPAPDIFLTCADELGCVPADTYVIEDSYNGIRAAHAAGMIPIMVPDMLPPTEEMKELAYRICQDLFEAKKVLESEA